MRNFIVFFIIIAFVSGGCSNASETENLTDWPTLKIEGNTATNLSSIEQTFGAKISDNEIKSCKPERVYKGEILTITFEEFHGGYLAIQRLSDKKWFFLYGVENSTPVWEIDELKALSEIQIDTGTAINSTNAGGNKQSIKIFDKSGRYRIMVSNEDFGQDDPAYQGVCEIFYVNKNRPDQKPN